MTLLSLNCADQCVLMLSLLLLSHLVMSDSLWPRGLLHTRLPCPSLSLLELAQTHVVWVSDVTQPSHPLSPPSPPALHLSQHQGLFQRVSSLHEVAKVLELQLQHRSFQWIFRIDFLQDWLVWSPYFPRDSLKSSTAPQFESINSSALIYDLNNLMKFT